jgi:hypothetical protein
MPRDKKDEARRHARFKPTRPVRFFLRDGTEIGGIVEVVDISESGLQFVCKGFIKRGSELAVTVDPEKKGGEPVRLKGSVAWAKTSNYVNGVFRVGVRFMDLSDAEREFLRALRKRTWFFGR